MCWFGERERMHFNDLGGFNELMDFLFSWDESSHPVLLGILPD